MCVKIQVEGWLEPVDLNALVLDRMASPASATTSVRELLRVDTLHLRNDGRCAALAERNLALSYELLNPAFFSCWEGMSRTAVSGQAAGEQPLPSIEALVASHVLRAGTAAKAIHKAAASCRAHFASIAAGFAHRWLAACKASLPR